MHLASKLAEFEASSDGFSFSISFVVILVVAVAVAVTALAAKRSKAKTEPLATGTSSTGAPAGSRAAERYSGDLTPEAVINKRFSPTKFRGGYDQDEVDDFLDRVVVELRRLDTERSELQNAEFNPGSPLRSSISSLTADEVENITFQPTKFREGYETSHVDEFLDEIVIALRKRESENEATRARIAGL